MSTPHYARINGHSVELRKAGNGTIWVHALGLARALGHANPGASIHYLITRKNVSYRRLLAHGERTASKWLTLKTALEFIGHGYMGTTDDADALREAAVKLTLKGKPVIKPVRTHRPARELSEELAPTPVEPAQNPAITWLNAVLADTTLPYSTQVTALNARRDILEIQADIERGQGNV